MIIADDLPTLQRQVERCIADHAESVGEKKATLRLLKKKFKAETIKDAKRLAAKRLKIEHQLLDDAISKKEAFLKKYKDKLTPTEDDDE